MIKIEVTGNSIGEVADKLLAIGSSLRANKGVLLNSAAHPVAINPIMPEVADISPEALEEVEIEVAEPVPAPQPAPEPKPTPAPAPAPAPKVEAQPAPAGQIDFAADVTPRVVKVVATCGKPAMAAILEQFGVAKASLISPDRLPELLAVMDDAIAGAA